MKCKYYFASFVTLTLMTSTKSAELPEWWNDRVGIGDDSLPLAVTTVGQIKNMAYHLHAEMNAQLPGGAGFDLDSVFPPKPANPDQAWYDAQLQTAVLGQLKAVTKPYYDRLNQLAPDWVNGQMAINGLEPWPHSVPWNPETPVQENLNLATLGQVKLVFGLRFRVDENQNAIPDILEEIHLKKTADIAPDFDSDHDGIPDLSELIDAYDPGFVDADLDGMPDDWEIENGLDPNDPNDASGDLDLDTVANLNEFRSGTNPNDADTDDDYVGDALELNESPLFALSSKINTEIKVTGVYQALTVDPSGATAAVILDTPIQSELASKLPNYSLDSLPVEPFSRGTVRFVNLDDDQLLDLVVTGSSNNIFAYRNVGTREHPVYSGIPVDLVGTIGYVKDGSGLLEDLTSSWGIDCSFHDVNGDLIPDLLTGDAFDGQISYYLRTNGTDWPPEYSGQNVINYRASDGSDHIIEVSDFIGSEDTGHASPVLFDIDGDLDDDLIVGNGLVKYQSFSGGLVGEGSGSLNVYKNTGLSRADGTPVYGPKIELNSESGPIYVEEKLGFSFYGGIARPSFADIDNDGDEDLFVSNSEGHIWLFVNTGSRVDDSTSSSDEFVVFEDGVFLKNELDVDLDFGDLSALDVVDYDGDGDFDLLVASNGINGYETGDVTLVRNVGDVTSARFDSHFVHVGEQDGTAVFKEGIRAKVAFWDLDQDGWKDMLLGNSTGQILVSINADTGDNVNTRFLEPIQLLNEAGDPLEVDRYSVPIPVDFNNDGSLDGLLVGANTDVIYFEKSSVSDGGGLPRFVNKGSVIEGLGVSGDRLYPALVDLDDNVTLDVVIGNRGSGNLSYLVNSSLDSFALSLNGDLKAGAVDIDDASTPVFFDADQDGDFDLFAGSKIEVAAFPITGDKIRFYKNEGTSKSPDFSVGVLLEIGDEILNVGDDASPSFVLYDDDNKIDLVVANNSSQIRVYSNTTGLDEVVSFAEPILLKKVGVPSEAVDVTEARTNGAQLIYVTFPVLSEVSTLLNINELFTLSGNRKASLDGHVVQEELDNDGGVGDGMPDWWEIHYGLDPTDPSDALLDSDNDNVLNVVEARNGTDPTKAPALPAPAYPVPEALTDEELKLDIHRFLTQATFGVRISEDRDEVQELFDAIIDEQNVGTGKDGDGLNPWKYTKKAYDNWIDIQFAKPVTSLRDYVVAADEQELVADGVGANLVIKMANGLDGLDELDEFTYSDPSKIGRTRTVTITRGMDSGSSPVALRLQVDLKLGDQSVITADLSRADLDLNNQITDETKGRWDALAAYLDGLDLTNKLPQCEKVALLQEVGELARKNFSSSNRGQSLRGDFTNGNWNVYATSNTGNGPFAKNLPFGWWSIAVAGEDQLRQRLAFALSQIFVVSQVGNSAIAANHYGLANYHDMLATNSSESFLKILEDVTYHPIMGKYLSHLKNRKAQGGVFSPDENYAREILQLFSIGLFELQLDGSMRTSSTGPIASSSSSDIANLARVFTGLSFGKINGSIGSSAQALGNSERGFVRDADSGSPFDFYALEQPTARYSQASWENPMIMYKAFHDMGPKTYLGYTSADVEDGAEDAEVKMALSKIAEHRNVGPFIGKKLIQRLVTSNPSKDYIHRVSLAFNGDGGASRSLGKMVKAILLDYEARSLTQSRVPSFGRKKEPLVALLQTIRAFHPSSELRVSDSLVVPANTNGVTGSWTTEPMSFYYPRAREDYTRLPESALRIQINIEGEIRGRGGFGQAPFRSPNVFNWFLPDFSPPGDLLASGLVAPEFQTATPALVAGRINLRENLFNVQVAQQKIKGFSGKELTNNESKMDLLLGSLLEIYGVNIDRANKPDILLKAEAMVDDVDRRLLGGAFKKRYPQNLLELSSDQKNIRKPTGVDLDPRSSMILIAVRQLEIPSSSLSFRLRMRPLLILMSTSPQFLIQK